MSPACRPLLLLTLIAGLAAADPWDRLAAAAALPPTEARPALEQLVLAHPAFLAARFNLGTLLLDSAPAQAAEHLQAATAAPDSRLAADAWYNLTLARFHQGRMHEALEAAERAAALDPAAIPLREEVRRVALARLDAARREAEEAARRLHLAAEPLPPARVGEAYAAQVPVRGGEPPYRVALAGETAMPDGLSLGSDGAISGVPRTAGSTKLHLELTDRAGTTATGTIELRVLPAPAITTATLPEAILGLPYTARLTAVGLDRPLRWSVANLPSGLAVDAEGVISGTPDQAGLRSLMVQASDGTRQADRLLELTVTDGFAPAEHPLPAATVHQPYTHRATVRGPAQAYRWSAEQRADLAIAADGTLTGTPTETGERLLPVVISAADGRTRAVELLLPVNPRPLIETEPITVRVGAPVDQAIKLTGGTSPFAWSVANGLLPDGLRLDPDGKLRGVARDPGTSTVTVAVADRWQASTQAEVTITVEARPDDPGEDKQEGENQQDGEDQPSQDGDQQQPNAAQQQQQPGEPQADGTKSDVEEQQEQAAVLNQAAADRWLDQLPEEARDVLRYQLLDGGSTRPPQQGKPW